MVAFEASNASSHKLGHFERLCAFLTKMGRTNEIGIGLNHDLRALWNGFYDLRNTAFMVEILTTINSTFIKLELLYIFDIVSLSNQRINHGSPLAIRALQCSK